MHVRVFQCRYAADSVRLQQRANKRAEGQRRVAAARQAAAAAATASDVSGGDGDAQPEHAVFPVIANLSL